MVNRTQITPPGLSVSAIRNNIPEQWSAAWFQRFVTQHLQNADIRNAVAGPGISITGNSTTPATVSSSQLVGSPFSVLGNPTDVSATDISIQATADGQVLHRSGDSLVFGALELANGQALGDSFFVTGATPGAVLQAVTSDGADFALVLPIAAGIQLGDLWYGASADTMGTLTVDSIDTNPVLTVAAGVPAWTPIADIAIVSVLGTANQIDVSTTTGVATVSIDAGYVGQTSITTLGTDHDRRVGWHYDRDCLRRHRTDDSRYGIRRALTAYDQRRFDL